MRQKLRKLRGKKFKIEWQIVTDFFKKKTGRNKKKRGRNLKFAWQKAKKKLAEIKKCVAEIKKWQK